MKLENKIIEEFDDNFTADIYNKVWDENATEYVEEDITNEIKGFIKYALKQQRKEITDTLIDMGTKSVLEENKGMLDINDILTELNDK